MEKSYIVAGMGFGDEGKGSIVDFLSEMSGIRYTIRYNGGNQAAHHVVKNGVMHCFSQFGSSTLSTSDTRTILSKYMLIEPYSLEVESGVLKKKGVNNPYSRLLIDSNCLIVTPMNKLINQMKEIINHNGSCGCGIGETVLSSKRFGKYSLVAGDISDINILSTKLGFLWSVQLDQAEQILEINPMNTDLRERYHNLKNIDIDKLSNDYFSIFDKIVVGNIDDLFKNSSIYEGSQGMLLDVNYGFHPYVTKTTTTFENAISLCKTAYKKIGVMRPYLTRHGNGPFPTQNDSLGKYIPDIHNGYNIWQGNFRVGWQDLLLMKYAIDISGKPDYIAMTNVDRISILEKVKLCVSYEYKGNIDAEKFFECKKIGRRYKLLSFKKMCGDQGRERNEILNDCIPVYKTFYKSDMANCWKEYFDFIESDDGIGVPIGILSMGMESTDKQMLCDI